MLPSMLNDEAKNAVFCNKKTFNQASSLMKLHPIPILNFFQRIFFLQVTEFDLRSEIFMELSINISISSQAKYVYQSHMAEKGPQFLIYCLLFSWYLF